MNKNFIIGLMFLFLLSTVSAYLPHQQNNDFDLVISSNNATNCNLTYIQNPDGSKNTLNLAMTKDGTSFIKEIKGGNFSLLGDSCIHISCFDGITYETGSICREITPSGKGGTANIVFFVFVILMLYGITFVGFFGKNIPITILGGMAMLGLGLYTINNGIIIYQDWLTNYFSYITIAIGAVLALWAIIEWIQEELG